MLDRPLKYHLKLGLFVDSVLKVACEFCFLFLMFWLMAVLLSPDTDPISLALLVGSVFLPLLACFVVICGVLIAAAESLVDTIYGNDSRKKVFLVVGFIVLFTIVFTVSAIIYRDTLYEPQLHALGIPFTPGPRFWK